MHEEAPANSSKWRGTLEKPRVKRLRPEAVLSGRQEGRDGTFPSGVGMESNSAPTEKILGVLPSEMVILVHFSY